MNSLAGGFKRWASRQAARVVLGQPGLTRAVVRAAGSPSLFELSSGAASWHTEAAPFLAELPGTGDSLDAAMETAESVVDAILERSETVSRRYPGSYAVERETSRVLYGVVRCLRPKVVVETGVADGLSSAVVLEALAANGSGVLHSIDIADDVGALIRDRSAWRLHVVSEASLAADLAEVAESVGPIDLFLHDANHDYRHQMLDYTTFWPVMAPGGVFLSDDVEWSYAFLDFVEQVKRRPAMLLDRRKVIGMITRPGTGTGPTDTDG